MAIIKQVESGSIAHRAVVLDLGDLRRTAEAMEASAKAHARSIIEEAHAERGRIIAGAAEKGFAEGRAAGDAKGFEEGLARGAAQALAEQGEAARGLIASWRKALDDFEARREGLHREASGGVLALAIAIAERLVKRAIEHDPMVVVRQMEEAISLATSSATLAVMVSPMDESLASSVLGPLLARLGSASHATLHADASLSRGSVVVRTGAGEVDARIETQMERIVRAILPGSGEASVDAPTAAGGEGGGS